MMEVKIMYKNSKGYLEKYGFYKKFELLDNKIKYKFLNKEFPDLMVEVISGFKKFKSRMNLTYAPPLNQESLWKFIIFISTCGQALDKLNEEHKAHYQRRFEDIINYQNQSKVLLYQNIISKL